MMPENKVDGEAEKWFNSHLDRLRYHQDYTICFGHSKNLMKDGKQVGITIHRPYIRLFGTGMTKLYQMIVLGEELPKVEYTKSEEKELDKAIAEAEKKHQSLMEAEK